MCVKQRRPGASCEDPKISRGVAGSSDLAIVSESLRSVGLCPLLEVTLRGVPSASCQAGSRGPSPWQGHGQSSLNALEKVKPRHYFYPDPKYTQGEGWRSSSGHTVSEVISPPDLLSSI